MKNNNYNEYGVGINLGTTYCSIATYKNGKFETISNEFCQKKTPCCVSFLNNEIFVGESAINLKNINYKSTIYDIKTIIGRKFTDNLVQRKIKEFPFEIIQGKENNPYILVDFKDNKEKFAPEEIFSFILRNLKASAQLLIPLKLTNAVLTVPPYFNDSQRQATKDAATIAGLKVLRIINDVTSAALAYGLDEKYQKEEKNVLVFDLGAKTMTVSLLNIEEGIFEIKNSEYLLDFGGDDFSENMILFCQEHFKNSTGIDTCLNIKAYDKLKFQCEMAKRSLSYLLQVKINIENLVEGQDFEILISRAKFEEINFLLFKRYLSFIHNFLQSIHFPKEKVDEIILIGGSSKMPKIFNLIKDYFRKKPLISIEPDEVKAIGASIQCFNLVHPSIKFEMCCFLDFTPLNLGIETIGGIMAPIILRNSCIPLKKSKLFSIYQDNVNELEIKIYEGQSPFTKYNFLLGILKLDKIPPCNKGILEIEITFEIDVNCIFTVTAQILETTIIKALVIINDEGRLSSNEIRLIINEAEKNLNVDMIIYKNFVEKNKLFSFCHYTKKFINDPRLEDKLSLKNKNYIEFKIGQTIDQLLKDYPNNFKIYNKIIDDLCNEFSVLIPEIMEYIMDEFYHSLNYGFNSYLPPFAPSPSPNYIPIGGRIEEVD